jgi:hypothetical protein
MTGIIVTSLARSPEQGRQLILLYPRGILQLIEGNKRMGWGFYRVLRHRACRGGRYRGSRWRDRDDKHQVLKVEFSPQLWCEVQCSTAFWYLFGMMPIETYPSRGGFCIRSTFPAEDKRTGASSSEGTFSYFQSIARRECLGDVSTQVMSRPR